ncbi:28S ribosomal protein S36, mitochondrial-like [Lytechinus variegatus]|uniref:28S ribosomal protein S36, mitochondrial-like n=1 Tax=Lytechinus variegatus TaxID=7654 RepID=UPI001BB16D53|nr:28S ribosomal protein S36, mitochondrial-like [Lytechinus variegatus]
MSANRVIQAIRPHIPLIKFRAGGGGLRKVIPPAAVTSTPHPSSSSSLRPPSNRRSDAPEFFQLDPKYHRNAITQEEIDFINRGGPD